MVVTLRHLVADFRHFRAAHHSRRAPWVALLAFLADPHTPAIVLMRFAAEGNPPVSRLASRRLMTRFASEVQRGTEIGEGFLLGHANGIVIASRVIIGRRVTLFHNVTLGFHHAGWPTLEDDVRVLPGAVIVGAITIGRNALIGANAYVSADVPENGVVRAGTRWTRDRVTA